MSARQARRSWVVVTVAITSLASVSVAAPRYERVVRSVAGMVDDSRARSLVEARRLDLLNVMWEDTGRYLGSSVGPNISDVTIEVDFKARRGKVRSALMPVMRYPNFADKTGDVKLDKFFVRVGNEKPNGQLATIPLREYLAHPLAYMTSPQQGMIKGGTLLARRDHRLLVSAQAAFLPIQRDGQAIFRPVIFNYQSQRRNPAVLAILVTREGTSMTVVDNARDTLGRESWGQRLFFNAGGQRAALTAERLSDVKQRGATLSGESASELQQDSNLLMLIQVPLRQRAVRRAKAAAKSLASGVADSPQEGGGGRRGSDVEEAVLGHGPLEGPFTELGGLTVERDPRFPIRVTVQFYQATSNGVINRRDVGRLARQIAKVYRKADYVGSLVLDRAARSTLWTHATPAPAGLSWEDFPGLVDRYRRLGPRSIWTPMGIWFPPSVLMRASTSASASTASVAAGIR
jgi:hypothetical protein